MVKTQADIIEDCLQPLYLVCSGYTLDRIRHQLGIVLDVGTGDEEIPSDPIIFSAMTEDFDLAFAVSIAYAYSEYAHLRGISETLNVSESQLATIAMAIAEHLLNENTKKGLRIEQSDKAVCMDGDSNTAIFMSVLLELSYRKSAAALHREGHTPIVSVISYRTLAGEKKIMFSVLWRRL